LAHVLPFLVDRVPLGREELSVKRVSQRPCVGRSKDPLAMGEFLLPVRRVIPRQINKYLSCG
jgi:hypothetical protein